MAIGFRSGHLDLFTLLGISTVSIGLRNMVGEFRHGLWAKEAFKRIHVQYDQSRHNTTAYVKPRSKNSLPKLTSSFWSYDAPVGVKKREVVADDDKKKQQAQWPSIFTAFDKIVLEVGLKVASENYLKWTKSTQSLKEGISTNPTETRTARYYYPKGLTEDKKLQHFKIKQELDTKDINAREKRRTL